MVATNAVRLFVVVGLCGMMTIVYMVRVSSVIQGKFKASRSDSRIEALVLTSSLTEAKDGPPVASRATPAAVRSATTGVMRSSPPRPVNFDPIRDKDPAYKFFAPLLNVSSDSDCKVADNGDFTDGYGNQKIDLQEYSCEIKRSAPSNAIVQLNRNLLRVTCQYHLIYRLKPGDEWRGTGARQASDTEVKWSGEFIELMCKDGNYVIWQDVVIKVEEKQALRTQKRVKPGGLNIAVVALDSVSRAGAMHYLPNTVALLKALSEGDGTHRPFIFNRAQINGAGTANNISPLLCGRGYTGSFNDMVLAGWQYTECTEFIWNHLQSQGYVSSYGVVSNMIAGQPNWNATSIEDAGHTPPIYTSFEDSGDFIACSGCSSGVVPCYGAVTPGAYLFKHASDFHSNKVYSEAGKFSFVHLMSAHSNEGHIQSEDKSIHTYITEMLKRNDTVVHLVSDHGNGNEGWRLPLSALLVPRHFLNRNPETEILLETNQQRLTSHFDMYETYKHFASYPNPPRQESWEKKPTDTRSLLSSEIPPNRKCSDIGVPSQFCACLEFKNFSVVDLKAIEALPGHADYHTVVTDAIKNVLHAAELSKSKAEQDGTRSTCAKIELGAITEVSIASHVLSVQGDATGDQGIPVRTIEVKYNVKGHTDIIMRLVLEMVGEYMAHGNEDTDKLPPRITLLTHGMLSTYHPFAGCQDKRVSPHYCICNINDTGIEGPYDLAREYGFYTGRSHMIRAVRGFVDVFVPEFKLFFFRGLRTQHGYYDGSNQIREEMLVHVGPAVLRALDCMIDTGAGIVRGTTLIASSFQSRYCRRDAMIAATPHNHTKDNPTNSIANSSTTHAATKPQPKGVAMQDKPKHEEVPDRVNHVVIFTKDGCMACKLALSFLTKYEIAYIQPNCEYMHSEQFRILTAQGSSSHYRTVYPIILISDDGGSDVKFVGGLAELKAALSE